MEDVSRLHWFQCALWIYLILTATHQGDCKCDYCQCCTGTCNATYQCDGQGCVPGFWTSYCTIDCNEGCPSKTCDQWTGYCTPCNDGYYGDSCQWRCRTNCLGPCSQSDGSCSTCKDGYWGDKLCYHRCQANCKSCISIDKCNTCDDGYWGNTCTQCNENCADSCDQISGLCQKGCKKGFWGDYCNHTCSDRCNGECVKGTGHCKQCKSQTVHGPFCNQECSTNCLLNECEQTSGECTKGCTKYFFGSKCEHSCSLNCLPSIKNATVCSHVDGTCIYGCREGFTGDLCDERRRQHDKGNPSQGNVYIIVGALVGSFFLLAVVVVVTVVLLKRRQPQRIPKPPVDVRRDTVYHENAVVYDVIPDEDEGPAYAVADPPTALTVSPVHGHHEAEIVEGASAMTAEYLTPVSRPRVVRIYPDTTADDDPKYQQLETSLTEHVKYEELLPGSPNASKKATMVYYNQGSLYSN